ncbi:glucan endo-1,3-beta-glucosidase-like [Silene latifolia]|uniref:glucan endo-1,3-beta-glucosidase-like n=1 Tax=Silene latifolia TaxID=37657 RepID=UPI003D76B206
MKFIFRNMTVFMQLALIAFNIHLHFVGADMGVVYGMQGNNLPSPDDVVALYEIENIPFLRILEPHPDMLESLRAEKLKVTVGVKNVDIPNIAKDVNAAIDWVKTHIAPYAAEVNFGWIVVGNDMVPGPTAELLPVAMNNILSGLNAAALTNIKISTAVSTKVLGPISLPSTGDFTNESKGFMNAIIVWLRGTNNPLMINVDAYGTYISNLGKIPLNYAIFDTNQAVVIDGKYEYKSLFEAMVDTFYVAIEKNGGSNITLVVSETGWPSAGNEPHTSIENAYKFNQGLVDAMKNIGTPRRIDDFLDVFIFSMFNENKRSQGIGQHWGLHYANETQVYEMLFD